MSWSTVGAYACQNLQTSLVQYFGKNSPEFRTMGSVSLIKWLLSPQNTTGFKQIDINSIPGKKRAVAFSISLPYCFDLCAVDRLCTVPAVRASVTPQEIVFSMDDPPYRQCDGTGKPMIIEFDLLDMEKYCTIDDQTWITEQINAYLLQFEKALDKVLMTTLSTLVGKNLQGDAITQIPLFIKNTMSPTNILNPEGVWYMNQVMQDIGIDGQFGIVGGQIVNKITKYMGWASLNLLGVDLSKTESMNPYAFYDRNADTVLGTKDFLELAAGTVQLVTWNRYRGSKMKQVTDLYTTGTITLPTTGLQVDYEWMYDYNCKKWTFEAFLYAQLAAVPLGGCGALGLTNGILRVTDCGGSEVIPECPAVIP